MGEATKAGSASEFQPCISIHASRGGSDLRTAESQVLTMKHFNPRFPWGKRPLRPAGIEGRPDDFNPRFPWGKRLHPVGRYNLCSLFQSTLPVGEATRHAWLENQIPVISIHASRGGSDPPAYTLLRRWRDFNPRFPWGKRRNDVENYNHTWDISIHASRGGSDWKIPG